jgi:hypothetical protein
MFDGCYYIYTLIIFSVSLTFLLGVLTTNFKFRWKYLAFTPIIFIGLFLLFGIMGMAPASEIPKDSEYYYVNVTDIYTLRTMDTIEGNFVLGSGSIDGETYYVYYTQDSDGGYSINKVDANKCKIFMDNENGGILREQWAKWNQTETDRRWWRNKEQFIRYELHVPKGALVQQYNIR